MKYLIISIFISLFIFVIASTTNSFGQNALSIRTNQVITINGNDSESDWAQATWYPIDQLVFASNIDPNDFSGRFKSLWDEDFIYLLVEVTDDSLSDDYSNPLENYWQDDCVELFIDENNIGEDHQYNYNGFAYHVSLSGDVVDVGPSQAPLLLNDHIESMIQTTNHTHYWELKIKIFDDSFSETGPNTPVTLFENKVLGFSVGYCDNDETTTRENFIVSNPGQGDNGWKNTSSFGSLTLSPAPLTNTKDSENPMFDIYPTTVNDYFFINLTKTSEITVRDISGKLVYKSELEEGTHRITMKEKAGTYLVTVSNKEFTQTSSLIKK